MNSILEEQRALHEISDKIEHGIASLLNKQSHREKIELEHRICSLLEQANANYGQLQNLYLNEEERAKETDQLCVDSDLSEFYKRLKNVKDHHRRLDLTEESALVDIDEDLLNTKSSESVEAMFSGDEAWGKLLDLNELYQLYVNIKGISPVDYLAYVRSLGHVDSTPESVKKNVAYLSYLNRLITYLKSFIDRAQPLLDIEKVETEVEKNVLSEIESFSTTINIVYCDICRRAFGNQNVYDAHLSGKKHKLGESSLDSKSIDANFKNVAIEEKRSEILSARKHFLSLEYFCKTLIDILSPELNSTIEALERKQTLTLEEYINRTEEEKTEIVEPELVEKTIEEKFYNPLKLPMGWDGKPIPYWLYKLHGLGIEYPCEICGNFVYMGRRAFQRHFKESRHALGMYNLGIPNSKEFKEITKIQDALELWSKMQKELSQLEISSSTIEEFEDPSGNIYNRQEGLF